MTTRPGMTVSEHVQAALEFLGHSDRGAASHAVTAIAKQRGWAFSKYNHRWNAVRRLAEEYGDRALVAEFSVAQKFHANFYHNTMEDDEVERDRPIVQDFVRRIVGMVEESAP